jgi:GntR family phosphonate transport system transcriptional regulator
MDEILSGLPRWRQIEETLVREIANGTYSNESRFPTEQMLSTRFGVNRHTVRRALGGLARRGLLRVEQGRGSFLVEDAIEYAVGPRTRFSENLLRLGKRPAHALLDARELPADREVARWLKLRQGSPVYAVETLGEADGRPISLGLHYFPAQRVPDLLAYLQEKPSISRALARAGVENYRRARTRITARPPTELESQRLRMPASRPLLVTESLNVDAANLPIEYGIARFAADRVQLVVESE